MRFLLVNPFYPISETPSPPLGLAFLGAALEQAGIETQVLDLVVYPYSREMLQDLLAEFKPDIVGSTCVTMSFDEAIKVLRDIKDIDPSIATAMGGPHVTFRAEETLAENPFVDYIMQGEGEEAIVELTRAVETGQGIRRYRGFGLQKRRPNRFQRHPPSGYRCEHPSRTSPAPAAVGTLSHPGNGHQHDLQPRMSVQLHLLRGT
jgi:radical SAM superfamily enzyme YgiQ (UPF0313 family)